MTSLGSRAIFLGNFRRLAAPELMPDPLIQRLFRELKRRKVFRVITVYAVIAWGAVQIVDTITPLLRLPSWTPTLVLVLLLVGFPVALVLAWAFELTPEGVKRTGAAGPASMATRTRGRPGAAAYAVLGIVVVLAGFGGYAYLGSSSSEKASAPAERSIAVLPFDNLSDSKENEYFSDGITEDILTNLSRIDGLRVISRTSVMTYKDSDKTIPQIAKELGVTYVLEGSVRRADDRVRITGQLIRAADDGHLWAENYDRRLEDIFAIQSDVAQQIAAALEVELSSTDRIRIARNATTDVAAYDLYLQGRSLIHANYSGPAELAENLAGAMALFREALDHDPDYALAHAGLAQAYWRNPQLGFEAGGDSAITHARRAIRLDPELAEGHVELGSAHWILGEMDLARAAFERALELNPNSADAVWSMADYHGYTGDLVQALRLYKRAVRLEPKNREFLLRVSGTYERLGLFDRADEWVQRSFDVQPQRDAEHCERAALARYRGDRQMSERLLEPLRDRADELPYTASCVASHHATYREYEEARRYYEFLFAEIDRDTPEFMYANLVLGWYALRAGDEAEARELLARAERLSREELDREDWTPEYFLARIHALRGENDQAVRHLEFAADSGWRDYYEAQLYGYFEDLEGDPRYEQIMAEVKADLDRMRERVIREEG